MPRITIRDVADAAGVNHATVSRALAGRAGVAEATRQRVIEAARRLGYRPHPLLAALMATRNRPTPAPIPIAFLDRGRLRDAPDRHHARFATGIANRAAALGFVLHRCELTSDGLGIDTRLETLAVRGAILGPSDGEPPPHLDWSRRAWISCGVRWSEPPLHAVLADWTAKTRLALAHLTAHGCRRIALTINRAILDIAEGLPLAEFLRWQHDQPPGLRVPAWVPEAYDAAGLDAWYRAHRPDGLVTIMDQTAGLLRTLGHAPPPIMLLGPECGRGAHICEDLEDTGARAVDLLAQLIARDERGLPQQALTLLTPVRPCPVCSSQG